MAATDYEIRGSGNFCTVANLSAGVGPLDDVFPFTALKTVGGDSRVVGEGILIGSEIVRLVEVRDTSYKVARGCADTVPVAHASQSVMFFYEDAIGSDQREYAGGSTIGVKVLPHTTSSPALPIADSPPNKLAFNFRFARPYPPGQVKIGSAAWYAGFALDLAHPDFTLSWVHRNRVTQADQLIDHNVGNITPEVGQTYVLRLFSPNGTLRKTYAVTGTSQKVTWTEVLGAMPASSSNDYEPAYLLLNSLRDGLMSLQSYRIDITYDTAQPYGFGYRFGESFGGVHP